jgi:hypothetical protein
MLEQEINKLIEQYGHWSIEHWEWNSVNVPFTHTTGYRIANKLILESSLAECLTSPSEYIRECKKFFEAQNMTRRKMLSRYANEKMSKAR